MITGELWRHVPSEPQFMVSSDGRIMVTPYRGTMPHGGERWYGGQPHWGVWNKHDGRFITVYKNKTFKIHRLVCEAFNGPPPSENAVAMHIDENAANNSAGNLNWGTQKENLNADGFVDYCRERTGQHSPTTKGAVARAARISEKAQ